VNLSDVPGNRFAMVNACVQRARELDNGAIPQVPARAGENTMAIIARELKTGRLAVPDAAKD